MERVKETSSESARSAVRLALKHHQAIKLTNRDRDLFLAALDSDERPNAALRKATHRFKRRVA